MPEKVSIKINGKQMEVIAGTAVSAAMLQAGEPCRISVSGETRTALCGMGICFECRAVVNSVAHRRTCQLVCTDGMTVETMR
jgi:sarcosine oxidase subunit alpha